MSVSGGIRYLAYSQYYAWKSFFIYRLQAFISLVSSVVSLLTSVLAITVIYDISSGIPHWSYYQLLFLSVLSNLTFSIISYFNFYYIPRALRQGDLDAYFTKPVGLILLMMSPLNATIFPISVITSTVFLAFIVTHLVVRPASLAFFVLLYIAGLAALLMFLTMLAVLSYRLIKSGTFINRMANLLNRAGQYPLSIYGLTTQALLTLAIPVGIAAYYPAETLLGRIDPIYYLLFLFVALVFAIFSRLSIHRLMRGYSGGGG